MPVKDMYQEHSGYEGAAVYIKIVALVLFEDITDGKITQFSRYLNNQQLQYIEESLLNARTIDEDTYIAAVHYDEITEASMANSNLK